MRLSVEDLALFVILALIPHVCLEIGWIATGYPLWFFVVMEDVFLWLALVLSMWVLKNTGRWRLVETRYRLTEKGEKVVEELRRMGEGEVCESCGRVVPKRSNFCPYCGRFLREIGVGSTARRKKRSRKKRKKRKARK